MTPFVRSNHLEGYAEARGYDVGEAVLAQSLLLRGHYHQEGVVIIITTIISIVTIVISTSITTVT